MTEPKTPDQERLHEVATKISNLLEEANLGGICIMVSTESAEWVTVMPAWSGVTVTPEGIRVLAAKKSPQDMRNALHLIGSFRDMCLDYGKLMATLWTGVQDELKANGWVIAHNPFGSLGHGPSGRFKN